MNTNALKKFAQNARNLLLDDVSKRFLYWGFDKQGSVVNAVQEATGGYLFNENSYDDASIPAKWNSLVSAVGRHTVNDIIEEAAYTWFNRLIAIKILEQNGYDQPMLAYAAADLHEPVILRNAKRGIYPTSNPQEIQVLKRRLAGANDDEALATLLVSYCRNHQLLNRIFGHLDDYTELLIPGALLAKDGILELINDGSIITDADYREVELIGWLYQFYISDKKDDVFAGFKKKKKARAEDIPAATQIFTPKWIVKYLVENTVGRIWLDLHPESPIRETMKYLVEPENHTPDEPIIKDVTELKVLDPAVGSGHFLVVAFDLLMQVYLEEGYSKRKAVESIIEQNLYGLDICPRAAGLANFAILLKAAQYHAEVLRETHFPKVLAMPESYDFTRPQVASFLGTDEAAVIDEVHTAFKLLKQGQNIGSALILYLSDTSRTQLLHALNVDRSQSLDLSDQMALKCMSPFAEVSFILTDQFPAVVANPPYMGRKNMNGELVTYLKTSYPRSKDDLLTVFMEVCLNLADEDGLIGMINLPSWMFLSSYVKLRERIISDSYLCGLNDNGRGIFGSDFGSVSFFLRKTHKNNHDGVYRKLFEVKGSVESSEIKESRYLDGSYGRFNSNQNGYGKIPGQPIAYWVNQNVIELFLNPKLISYAKLFQGMITGDNKKFVRNWFEINNYHISYNKNDIEEIDLENSYWIPYNKGGESRNWYGNHEYVVNFRNGGRDFTRGKLQFSQYFLKPCFSWTYISSTSLATRYFPKGFLWDVHGSSAFPFDEKHTLYFLSLIASKVGFYLLNIINPTISFQVENIAAIPIIFPNDNGLMEEIDRLVKENINIAEDDWDSRETSWNFPTSPLIDKSFSLSESFNAWEIIVRGKFSALHRNEELLNEYYIEIYDLSNDLQSNVNLNDIAILPDELDRGELKRYHQIKKDDYSALHIKKEIVIINLLSYAVGCFMGRYRLDKQGLIITHPDPADELLSSYEHNGYTFEIDDDAIIPMMGAESPFSDDIVQCVQQFVLMVWGEDSYTKNLNFINNALGEDLEKFLTKKFWDFHKKMYKMRPIYWQVASPNGAFKVLVYMHRMNRFTVQKIRQNYLFKQINYLESEIARLKANEASLNSTEARKLDHFRSNLMECRDYDLLLKDVADRQIEFDLDDGVVENYKLFEGVVSKI